MEHLSFDVLVIGAGASGLMAALEIAMTGRTVAVIEAKDRSGGRIFTSSDRGVGLELGAEFVHGNLPLTRDLLQQAGAELLPVDGRIWHYKDGRLEEQDDFIEDNQDLEKKCKALQEDKSVAQFLEIDLKGEQYATLRRSLHNYVEGYYAANIVRASTRALCEEMTKAEDEQYRIRGGYRLLVDYLEQQCRQRGVVFFFSQPVTRIHWHEGEAEAITEKASFKGAKVLLTVPLGVLQQESIIFFPALPQVKKAAQALGFGHVVKLVLQFEDAFWKDPSLTKNRRLSDLSFLFSEEAIPTWWSHHPAEDRILTGWLGGPKAEALQFLSKEEVMQKALYTLGKIFNLDVVHLQQKLQATGYHNWSADHHFNGAYSYEVVGGNEVIRFLQQPVCDTLFFSGEGLHPGPQIGTVEGALASGWEAAWRMVKSFSH